MYKTDHHRRTSGQGDWSAEAGHRRRAKLGTKGPPGSTSVPAASPAKTRLVRSSERKQLLTPTAQQAGTEDSEPPKADEDPSEPTSQDAMVLTEEELVEARFREEMIERRRAEMLQKRNSEAESPQPEGSQPPPPPPPPSPPPPLLPPLPSPAAGAQEMPARPIKAERRQMQTAQDPQPKPQQEQMPPSSQSTPQEPMQVQREQMLTPQMSLETQQEQMQTPQVGPKELMRQRMLASKHRRQGVAALQSGEAAAALAALSEARALTPDDKSLEPLIQRAQVMLGRQEAEVNATGPVDGRADEGVGPRLAEPAPLPPPPPVTGGADALPEGWAEGSLEGTPFYYPVSDPSRIQWSPPLVHPAMQSTTSSPGTSI
jgi:hypothetical protein